MTNAQIPNPNSPDVLIITPEKSIGIDEVRTINNFLARKPIQSVHNTVYIKDAHLLTIPAQNALLKILEEPPGNSEIYLVTDQSDQLLPTILSRCQINTAPTTHTTPTNPSGFDLDSITTREQALAFLDGVEMYLHQNPNPQLSTFYPLLSNCRKYLKANVNLKLCLDYFADNLLSY
jgi:DNA polymerase III delta prime subunit